MCLLMILHRVHADFPAIIAANRHERADRPATEPRVHEGPVRSVAPVDLVGGGTWIGINEFGVIAAVTNGRHRNDFDPTRPSRGGLCLRVLQARSLDAAIESALTETKATRFNGFQLLLADRQRALVIANEGGESSTWLAPGVHVLTHRHGLDGWTPKQTVRAEDVARASLEQLKESLGELCRSHEVAGDPPFAPCVHDPNHGTRSSALVFVGAGATGPVEFAYTEGAPCHAKTYSALTFSLTGESAVSSQRSNHPVRGRS